MNEYFIPYELAVKLKEKGFDVPFYFYYRTDDKYLHHAMVTKPLVYCDKIDDEVVCAPTISQVLKQLREKYSIHISTKPYPCEDGIMWMYEIRKFSIYKSVVVANKTGFVEEERAAVAGIECVLDNLI